MQKERIALTFDDGPNPAATPEILQILKDYSARATFFVCGANIERHPDILRDIAEQGHLIGNHTFTHPRVKTMLGSVMGEIEKTQEVIEGITKQDRKIFRPPYGISSPWLNWRLSENGWRSFLFDVDPKDWRRDITAEEIVRKVVEGAKDGAVVLLHDGHNIDVSPNRLQTVRAVGQILEKLSGNFEFVTVLEL